MEEFGRPRNSKFGVFLFLSLPISQSESPPYHTLLESVMVIKVHCKLVIINSLLLLGNSFVIISYSLFQFIVSIIKLFLIKLHIKYHRYQS